jgi:hypothetical protein
VAVHVDRSVAEATRLRQSGDHRSPQTAPMEIREGIKEATPATGQPASFRKFGFVLVYCNDPGFYSQHRGFRSPIHDG